MAGGVDWDAFLEPMAEAGKSVADLAYTTEDGQSLIHRIEFFSGLHTPERAEDIGLGAGTIIWQRLIDGCGPPKICFYRFVHTG